MLVHNFGRLRSVRHSYSSLSSLHKIMKLTESSSWNIGLWPSELVSLFHLNLPLFVWSPGGGRVFRMPWRCRAKKQPWARKMGRAGATSSEEEEEELFVYWEMRGRRKWESQKKRVMNCWSSPQLVSNHLHHLSPPSSSSTSDGGAEVR